MAAVGHAQLGGELDHPVGAHDGGIEAIEVDAGGDGFDLALQRRKALQGIARHVLGHRDHRVGARLTSFDEALGDAAGDERRVQRGDPFDLEPARQRAGDPRRAG